MRFLLKNKIIIISSSIIILLIFTFFYLKKAVQPVQIISNPNMTNIILTEEFISQNSTDVTGAVQILESDSSQKEFIGKQEVYSFDSLAQQYYGDSSLWYIISSSNPNLKQNSYFPPIGIQIRIPGNIAGIISNNSIINER